jgi:lysophospholipase L1-like esterase
MEIIDAQVLVRRDVLAALQADNPTLGDGELLWVSDTRDLIAGPGAFNDLWTAAQSLPNRAAASATAAAASAATAAQIVSKGSAMEPWLSALANRASAPARWLAIGDSITEGSNASSIFKRWVQRLLTGLRARFPQTPVGGIGHLPPYYDTTTMGTPYTSANLSGTGKDTSWGPGRRAAVMTGASSYTYTVTGTSVWVWFAQIPLAGVMSVVIDGGTPATVNVQGALDDGHVWQSPALTAGQHTVTISVASGTVYFTGVTVFNGDEAAGVQLFEAGHYGWKTTDWANNGNYWPGSVRQIQPQLVTIALMTNDYQAGVDPAVCKTNITAMIAAVRAQCTAPPTVVLLTYPARGDVSSPAYPWSSYVAVAASIAAADAGVAHLDLSARYASPTAGNALGNWAADNVHPTDKGHGLIAETVLSFISPR